MACTQIFNALYNSSHNTVKGKKFYEAFNAWCPLKGHTYVKIFLQFLTVVLLKYV